MENVTRINTGFLTGNLFSGYSSDELDAIDTAASVSRYQRLCEEALAAKYPGAEIEVDYQEAEGCLPAGLKTRVEADGEEYWEDSHEAADIEEITSRVFQAGDWMVDATA